MSARVLPMLPVLSRLERSMATLESAELSYRAAVDAHADALTLVGLAKINGNLTVQHRRAVESRAKVLLNATFERDAAVTLLLRDWRDR